MFGKDIEQLISGTNALKDTTMSAIISLSSDTNYQLVSKEYHGGIGVCHPLEEPVEVNDVASTIISALSSMTDIMGKLSSLGSTMFTQNNTFTNSIGSPWKEIDQLNTAVNAVGSYGKLDWVGGKAGMLSLLNMVMTCIIDAKHAITTYQDWVQRGFDHVYNGNQPSITHTNKIGGEQSIGMVEQSYSDNVHIPKPSIDPF